MAAILFLKARDRRDTSTADLFGLHLETRTRKDGVTQQYRVAAKDLPPNRFKGVDPVAATPDMFDNSPERRMLTIEVGGKRRPITNAKGQKVGAGFKEQAAFWRWFGDSKMVEDGKPLVMYHGTAGDFSEFQWDRWPNTINAVGAWFASDADTASKFSGREGQVMPVYLRVEKPLYIDSFEDLLALWKEHAGGDDRLRNGDPEALRTWLRSQGHDGISMSGSDMDGFAQGIYVIPLEAAQIKSATGNGGTFDPSSPDMTKSFLFVKSHVRGYTRADGTVVRPHESKRIKKQFGTLGGMAKRAHASLSVRARDAVDSWNVNWSTGELERAFQKNDAIAAEIRAAFAPVREKLRSMYGDTVPLWRGEKTSGGDSDPGRKLFSWTPLPKLAEGFAVNSLHGIPEPITDEQIARAVERYNQTGFVTFGNRKYKRNPSAPEYYDIYDRDNQMITDGDDLEASLRDDQESRAELIARLKEGGEVYAADVPVDSIVWIPTGANLHQPEFIAMHNPRVAPAEKMAKALLVLR